MKIISSSKIVICSVTMLLCGFYNTVFNILRKASHLLGTVRAAAGSNIDYTDIYKWKDIALSVYDIIVIFNLSSGMIAAIQLITGLLGIIYSCMHTYGKKALTGAGLPLFMGALCCIIGIVSVISLYLSHSAGAVLSVTLVITELIVPIIYIVFVAKFHHRIKISIKTGETL